MKTHRLDDLGGKVLRKPACAVLFVLGIYAFFGNILSQVMEQVPHIMEQTRHHQALGLPGLRRKVSTL
jgi:hypothetical protein